MTRTHDMGGRFGDGPVQPEPEGKVFDQDWHARAMAVTVASGTLGQWTIDESRFHRESLAPQDYAMFSYYEKWIAALADLLVAKGVITADELAAGQGQGPSPLADRCVDPAQMAAILAKGGPTERTQTTAPRFAPGDAVQTCRPAANRLVHGGHTRLPAYAAGARGTILRQQGTHVLPDANAHGIGEAPEPLYAVAFPASELWATPEHPGDEVVLDLWESYLAPA